MLISIILLILLSYCSKSTVQINVKGVLTDKFEIHRGVKQGCPLSAVLYVVAFHKKILKQVLFCLAPEPEVESRLFPWSTLTVIVKV